MDNFKAIYIILSALEKNMDSEMFDIEQIGPEILGVSKERWMRYIEMMLDVGYIKGVEIKRYTVGTCRMEAQNMRITLKGLEYLQENAMMRKAYRVAKGIKEITPGL